MEENEQVKPGIHAGIPNAAYHGGPGISKSGLDLIHRSPMHYWHAVNSANDNDPTTAQRIGTAFHALVLEPDEFAAGYVLPFDAPDGALVTSDDIKERLKSHGLKVSGTKPELISRLREVEPDAVFLDDLKHAYAVENAGRVILTTDEWDQLHAMRDAVLAHPVAGKLLTAAPGDAELSVYWTDQETGELCRCRPDFWRRDGILVDVKTTDDASPEAFARSLVNWRYHVQHPFYLDGCAAAIKQCGASNMVTPRHFLFLVVEKKAPYAVAVYRLNEESVDAGRREYRRDLDLYAKCRATNDWPGYPAEIQPIDLPTWYLIRSAEGVA
jgi:hypothetical protein